jgi:hypothetical protein
LDGGGASTKAPFVGGQRRVQEPRDGLGEGQSPWTLLDTVGPPARLITGQERVGTENG